MQVYNEKNPTQSMAPPKEVRMTIKELREKQALMAEQNLLEDQFRTAISDLGALMWRFDELSKDQQEEIRESIRINFSDEAMP